MKKAYFFILVVLLISVFAFKKDTDRRDVPGLPVYLLYIKNKPPDSIQTFIKLYLQSKKVKVIDWNEVMALTTAEVNAEATALITSGNLNTKTAKNFTDKVNPVSNVLGLQIFNSLSEDSSEYYIDSVSWQVSLVPAKDTFSIKRLKFLPANSRESNPYLTLKALMEKILSSGYLK